jgi:hypothetical protein
MEQPTSSRPSTSRTRTSRSGGGTSEDLVGTEDAGLGSGDVDSRDVTVSSAPDRSPTAANTEQRSRGLASTIKERAATQLTTQKDRATEGIGTLAQAVRQTTDRLRSEEHDTVAHYVERAAEQLEQFSNSLREKDVNELLRDAQRFARRQPALFIGGSFAVGLLAARFFKSSGENDTRGAYDYAESPSSLRTLPSEDIPGAY